jgi:hypothetical protein
MIKEMLPHGCTQYACEGQLCGLCLYIGRLVAIDKRVLHSGLRLAT